MSLRLALAYDGSPSASSAIAAAATLFPGARATVITAPPAEAPPEEGVAQAAARGLDAEPAIAPDRKPAWAALLEAAHERGAHALVCGTRGRGRLARTVLGSTSAGLLDNTDLPLLVVPAMEMPADGPVVAAYDGSDAAGEAIAVAAKLLGNDRPAIVVHAWEPHHHRAVTAGALAAGALDLDAAADEIASAAEADALATTQRGVTAAVEAGLAAVGETVEAEQTVARTLRATARRCEAALVVTGSRGLGGAQSALHGSVSSDLLEHAERPVLVVPPAAS